MSTMTALLCTKIRKREKLIEEPLVNYDKNQQKFVSDDEILRIWV